jgi:hypothetical protein
VAELMPIWIEAGFNFSFPVEVAARNDVVAYRRQYGRTMAYEGCIDKRALAAGGETMRAEVMRVVPPDISWPDYVAYSRLLARLTGWL